MVEKYNAGWLGRLQWCKNKSEVITRPAHLFYVAIYLNHLFFTRRNKGSINTTVYGIRWAHHSVGLESPSDNELVKFTQEGCIRLCGGNTVKKEALSTDKIKGFGDKFWGEKANSKN